MPKHQLLKNIFLFLQLHNAFAVVMLICLCWSLCARLNVELQKRDICMHNRSLEDSPENRDAGPHVSQNRYSRLPSFLLSFHWVFKHGVAPFNKMYPTNLQFEFDFLIFKMVQNEGSYYDNGFHCRSVYSS